MESLMSAAGASIECAGVTVSHIAVLPFQRRRPVAVCGALYAGGSEAGMPVRRVGRRHSRR